MATTKNIIMKQFNGTDYDTLYPKTVAAQIDDVYSKNETYSKNDVYTKSQVYTKTQTLTDATKAMYGLSSSAAPDDVFKTIPLSNTGYIYVTTKTSAGIAVPGIPLFLDDAYLGKTKSDGTGRFSVPFGEHTIKIIKPVDCSSVSPANVSISVFDAEIKTINVTCALSTSTNATISTSGFYGFSDRVSDFDVCVVGGGAGGAATAASTLYAPGGGGGYVTNQFNISAKKYNSFSAVIGAGGVGGKITGEGGSFSASEGANGGETSIKSLVDNTIISALGGMASKRAGTYFGKAGNGGSGGGGGNEKGVAGAGGTDGGDGEGAYAHNTANASGGTGQGTTTRPFGDTTKTPLSPGGGGAAVTKSTGSAGTAQSGGSPGAYSTTGNATATTGTVMGAGGGGASTLVEFTAKAASGVAGGILLRWRFK